jgi:hypothetical protein
MYMALLLISCSHTRNTALSRPCFIANKLWGTKFSFQYTLIRAFLSGLRPNILMTALTDYTTGEHHYSPDVFLFSGKVNIDAASIRFSGSAELRKGPGGMRLFLADNEFSLGLALSYGKCAVWHCDIGLLKLGIPDTRKPPPTIPIRICPLPVPENPGLTSIGGHTL